MTRLDAAEEPAEETRRLRRTVRDLVALSTLPGAWAGLGSEGIARSLGDMLLDTLSLDLIYVRLTGLGSEDVTEIARSKHSRDVFDLEQIKASISAFISSDTATPSRMANPFGDGDLRLAVTRLGVDEDDGVIVSGSQRKDFPTEHDGLLLGVAANQAAIVVQRRRSEKEARDQREWLRVTLAGIGEGVIATDTSGRVTFLNDVAEELTGWTTKEAQNLPLDTVFPTCHEQTREPLESPVASVLRKVEWKQSIHSLLIARDGVERPIDASAVPIRDSAGNMVGAVLTFRDVSEQQRSERKMRQNEARNRAILDTALDCIITIDHLSRVIEFNPAAERTFGFARADVLGRELTDLIIPPHLRERHRQGMARYLATGEGPAIGKRLELPAIRADGSEFPVELAITRISAESPPMFTAYLRDLTEPKRVEVHRSLRHAATQILSEATNVVDGARGVLRNVCECVGWDVGFFWTVDPEANGLACRACWSKPEINVEEFETASFARVFAKGVGLPGRVWDSHEPIWVRDLVDETNFPRLPFATRAGLHSAFAYPVHVGGEMLGVIEFFTARIREVDAHLLETMETVAGGLGQFIERNLAEEALRQSEQELSDFFENATVGLHWVGADGVIERANKAELDMLGYTREEYVGRRIADFHVDQQVIGEILDRLRAGEKLTEYPAQLRCKDGSVKDVLIDSSALFRDGTFIHTRCFTRDVTERKLAAIRARDQELRIRTILESVSDAFWSVDRDWRFVYVNRKAEELLNRTREDLLGKNLWEEFPPVLETEFYHAYHRAVNENVTVTVEAFYPPHNRWYEVNAYPSRDGLSVYFRDASLRRNAEAAVRESEEKLRLLANTIPQLAWMADPDGYIFWYNQRWYEYTGTTPEQMAGWGWQSTHDPEVLPAVLERWKRSIATAEPFDMVFPLRGADSEFRPFLTRVNPLRGEDGQVLYWFGTNTDISDIKRMEAALLDADRRKDEFLATLAHELRNPLAPIRNSLQILKMSRVDAAAMKQARDMMERQVQHLVRLVDDLLDASRVMRGKIELRKEPVELATAVARAVEMVQPLIEVQGQRLDLSLTSESLLLDADPVRLTQIVTNLLTNAAKYTDADGRIWLTAERRNDRVVLKIRDTGIGISRDMLPHVFELFVQADHAATRAHGGLGIGLTLVKNLVEMHGGTVEARSGGAGKGSEFEVNLPLLLQETQEANEPQDGDQPEYSTAGYKLLVVDDNQDAAISLAMLLRLRGHQVRVVHDGTSALDVAPVFNPHMIFLDIGMPGMDGYEVARRLRGVQGLENVRLVALTGWGQEEDRRRSAEAGFDHHVVKPPEPTELAALLEELKPAVT